MRKDVTAETLNSYIAKGPGSSTGTSRISKSLLTLSSLMAPIESIARCEMDKLREYRRNKVQHSLRKSQPVL